MRKNSINLLVLLLFVLISVSTRAQSDFNDIFKSGLNNVTTLAEGYVRPFGYGFSSGLGNNWYNTAATHKLLGFDLTVGGNAVFAPASEKSFSLSGLKNLTAVNGETTAPSFAGKGDGVLLALKSNNQTVTQFRTPDGVSSATPVPSLQLTVGLPLGNDLSIRLLPSIHTDDFKCNMWGIGLKHNIKQWIPVVNKLPFDAAVMLGYTKFNLEYNFGEAINPTDLVGSTQQMYLPAYDPSLYQSQGAKVTASALMANVIVSKKLAFLTPYVGFGLTSSKFDFNFTGTFPVIKDFNQTTMKYEIENWKDPIPLHYSKVQPGLTAGIRMKLLWIFALHAQYTIQQYATASVGIGLSIR